MISAGEWHVEVCKGLLNTTFKLKDVATGMRLQTKTWVSVTGSRMALLGGQTFRGPLRPKLLFEFINKRSYPGLEAVLAGFSPSIIF